MFPAIVPKPTSVSLRWSEEKSFGHCAFYKHYVPMGPGKTVGIILLQKRKLMVCFADSAEDFYSESL